MFKTNFYFSACYNIFFFTQPIFVFKKKINTVKKLLVTVRVNIKY